MRPDAPGTRAGEDPCPRVVRALLAMQRESWEQGVAAQALLELGERELAFLLAHDAVVRQDRDGRLGALAPAGAVTDPAANGEAVLAAAEASGDARLAGAAARMLSYLLERAPRCADGTLQHVAERPEVWIDSAYMAPPFLARAGRPREALAQLAGIRRRLWLPEKRLYAAIWDEGRGRLARAAAWGVGNGWAAAGAARVLDLLPAGFEAERARLADELREVLDGCLVHQRPDGLFHDVVDDSSTFAETNVAQMLAYVTFRGVRAGWLAPAYLPAARRMRAAARAKVDAQGLVQGVCGAPRFDAPGTAPEGQAFFLLMEAAARACGER